MGVEIALQGQDSDGGLGWHWCLPLAGPFNYRSTGLLWVEGRLAVVVGQPSKPGPYTIRVKMPHGERLMPHKHPEDRVYTVISGIFYIRLGDEFDASKLEAYPPGAVIILPGNTPHFHWAKSSEYVTQVSAMGPLGLEYLSAKDDPRIDKL